MVLEEIRKLSDRKKFLNDIKCYNQKNDTEKFKIEKKDIWACYEWNSEAGTMDEHYLLQDLYMAKKVI